MAQISTSCNCEVSKVFGGDCQHTAPEAQPDFCHKCNGTGEFKWGGAVINGVWQGKSGMCFACRGKGWLDKDDLKRNEFYWNEIAPFRID